VATKKISKVCKVAIHVVVVTNCFDEKDEVIELV